MLFSFVRHFYSEMDYEFLSLLLLYFFVISVKVAMKKKVLFLIRRESANSLLGGIKIQSFYTIQFRINRLPDAESF